VHANFALAYVRSVKRVEAICTKDALLEFAHLFLFNVFLKIAVLEEVCLNFGNQNFQGVELVTRCVVMKVELLVF